MNPMYTVLLRFKISISVLGAILLVACPASTSRAGAASSDSPFPVRVSTNGRYLEDARGKPFLLQGDTAGSYAFEWFNPTTGSVASTGSVKAAGGNQTFTPPFSGPAVLYLIVADSINAERKK